MYAVFRQLKVRDRHSQTGIFFASFCVLCAQKLRVVTYVYLVVFVGMNTYLQITYFTKKSSFW